MNLKKMAFKGTLWSSLNKVLTIVIRIVSTIVIARYLMPYDYGLIAMLYIFMVIASALIDSGMREALIRKDNMENIDLDTLFWFNLSISILLYSILFLTAPFIAEYYNETNLVTISRVLFLVIIIKAVSSIQEVILIKEIDFKSLTRINIVSEIFGVSFAVLMAYNNFGVWSLIALNLTPFFLKAILLWRTSYWMPRLKFSIKSFKAMYGFGYKLLLSGLIYQIANNIIFLLIGKQYNVQEAGYYFQANKMKELSIFSMTSIVQSVTYPLLSKIQSDTERLKLNFRKIIVLISFIIFPLIMILYMVAETLIPFLLTDKWTESGKYLKILCLTGLIIPVTMLHTNILKVLGRSDVILKLDLIKQPIMVLTLIIMSNYEIDIMVKSYVFMIYIDGIFTMLVAGRYINYTLKEQFYDYGILVLIAVAPIIFISYISLNYFFMIFIYLAIYLFFNIIFNKKNIYQNLLLLKEIRGTI